MTTSITPVVGQAILPAAGFQPATPPEEYAVQKTETSAPGIHNLKAVSTEQPSFRSAAVVGQAILPAAGFQPATPPEECAVQKTETRAPGIHNPKAVSTEPTSFRSAAVVGQAILPAAGFQPATPPEECAVQKTETSAPGIHNLKAVSEEPTSFRSAAVVGQAILPAAGFQPATPPEEYAVQKTETSAPGIHNPKAVSGEPTSFRSAAVVGQAILPAAGFQPATPPEEYAVPKTETSAPGIHNLKAVSGEPSVLPPLLIRAATVRERHQPPMPRQSQRGLTLVELVVAFTIMLILSSMAIPLARSKVRATRERELRYDLEDMRHAIDKYKDMCDAAYLGPVKAGTDCFPESLEILVDGIKLPGPDGKKLKLLRRVPRDPFTHTSEWGIRSDQDDPTSMSWGGQNVFDVYSKTMEKDGSGRAYSDY